VVRSSLAEAIENLQKSYIDYMSCLKSVLDFGEANIEPLIDALNHRYANPMAKALGLMMYSPTSQRAFPVLLAWLVTQSPMYPDVLEALVRAGDKPAPLVLDLIKEYADFNDEGAVRNLFDLATRFSDAVLPRVVQVAETLFDHDDPTIRECATDAIWKIGLPHGATTRGKLSMLQSNDPDIHVRKAASEALQKLG